MSEIPAPMAFPAAPEAEVALLAALLAFPAETQNVIAENCITAEHFRDARHEMFFSAFTAIQARGHEVTLATMIDEVGRVRWEPPKDNPEPVNMILFNELCGMPVSGIRSHAALLHEKFVCKRLWEACRDTARKVSGAEPDGVEAMAELLTAVGAITQPLKSAPTMRELVREKVDRMKRNEEDVNRIPTGLTKLDQFSPLRYGSMPLISGEKKAGKSMLAMNIAVNIAHHSRVRVLYLSLEMSAGELVDRVFAKIAGVPTEDHKFDGLTQAACEKLIWAGEETGKLPMDIRSDLHDLQQIVAYVRAYKVRNPSLGVVVVDYAQLVRCSLGKGANREQEVAHVSRTLRLLSLELNIALIVLCQLNTDGATRESKGLENDCTAMWRIAKEKMESGEFYEDRRFLHIPYQRGGQSGIGFAVTYIGNLCRVLNFADEPDEPEAAREARQGHPNPRKNNQ